jgi:hypothetical protein
MPGAEHSADVHTLVYGLAEAATPRTSHHYLGDPSKAKGAAKALLYAAFGAAAWNAQSALLQSHLSFAGAPAIEFPAGAGSTGISNGARVEIHMLAALQSTNFDDTYCRRTAASARRVNGVWGGWGLVPGVCAARLGAGAAAVGRGTPFKKKRTRPIDSAVGGPYTLAYIGDYRYTYTIYYILYIYILYDLIYDPSCSAG